MVITRVLFTVLLLRGVACAQEAASGDAPTRMPEMLVPGERVGRLDVVVPRGDLRPPEPNLGAELLALPGVYGHARAVDAMEPSIRGLSFDRIGTSLNGVPLVNGSPERTSSPVVMLGPAVVTDITVTKALPSVTLGPVTTGGHIGLRTDGALEADARRTGGHLTSTWHAAREGFTTQGRWSATQGAVTAEATFFQNRLGHYTAPHGEVVAARLEDHGGSAALGWHAPAHRARVEVLHRRLERQDTLSLPLDGRATESTVVTFSDRWTWDDARRLKTIEWRAGYSLTDPFITNEARPAPARIFAQATARSFGGGLKSVWRANDASTLALGFDHAWQRRRAVRTTPAGTDFIWPNAVYADTGLFAEWETKLSPEWQLRVGARGDDVRSEARDADRLALGRPIRDQFVTYNGPAAARTDHHDRIGATNLLFQWKRSPAVTAFFGAGVSRQPAAATERYRAFLNALGGDGRGGNAVELGNPALRAETKFALEAGGTWHREKFDLEATAYAYRVEDFILRLPVGATVPPLAPMVVFGYRNVDAEFLGGEISATLRPNSSWALPATFAVAKGRRADTGVGLPEIPPWEATLSARYQGSFAGAPLAAHLGVRLVASRANPAPLDNPLFKSTGGFAVWHLRVGVPVRRWLKLNAGIENAFDHAYTEYLTPPVGPARPAAGNLQPGARIPAPGRSVWVAVTVTW